MKEISMRKKSLLVTVCSAALFLSGCVDTLVTEDNIVIVERSRKDLLNKEEQEHTDETGQEYSEETGQEQTEKQEQEFTIDQWYRGIPDRITKDMSNEILEIHIDAAVDRPSFTAMPARHGIEIVFLDGDEQMRRLLVDFFWGDEAEGLYNSGFYEKYGFYWDSGGASLDLSYGSTIIYHSKYNNKPYPQDRDPSITQIPGADMSMEEAEELCGRLWERMGQTDVQLVQKSVALASSRSMEAESGEEINYSYYYLRYAQSIDGVPIGGFLDNQNMQNADLGPGQKSALINCHVDDSGIFRLSGNLYRFERQQDYSELLSMDQVMECLEAQMSVIAVRRRNGEAVTDIPVCEIQFVYMVNADDRGGMYIEPFWKFIIGEEHADGTIWKGICVNAVTGEVAMCYE